MTEKQYKYILDICPQTLTFKKYPDIKPFLMKEKLLKFPNDIIQLLIQYGKLYQEWCRLGDDEIRQEHLRNYFQKDEVREEREYVWTKFLEVSQQLEDRLLNEVLL
jgi:hypothetical protein